MRYLIGLAAVGFLPRLGWGQGAPGTNLRVDVRVARIETRADTAHVEYIVHNHPESAEPLFEFRVEAPAAVVRIFQPQPADAWATGSVVKGISMANWGMLGTHLAAGADSPPLPFEALGLPTVVTYFATGWFPVPPYTPPLGAEPPLAPREALLASSVTGATVGIQPFPEDLRPASPRRARGPARGRAGQACDGQCLLAAEDQRGVRAGPALSLDRRVVRWVAFAPSWRRSSAG